ncbi:MAG TPA: hypothetical protein VF586_05360, partial [Pyrinomonadaceae bacterium]
MELDREQKLEQLERVLQSRTLQNSESLKAFLRFVVEKTLDDQGAQLKEYTIATEVFGRNSDYDPRIDSVVRVQAGRLRTKLQEYYTTEGKGDSVVIDLPKGHYYPVFTCPRPDSPPEPRPLAALPPADAPATNGHAAPAPSDAPAEGTRARGGPRTFVVPALCAAVVLLGAAALALYAWNRELRRQVAAV